MASLILITAKKWHMLSIPQKQMEFSPNPAARNVFSFTLSIWRLMLGKDPESQLSNFIFATVVYLIAPTIDVLR